MVFIMFNFYREEKQCVDDIGNIDLHIRTPDGGILSLLAFVMIFINRYDFEYRLCQVCFRSIALFFPLMV